jgi:hypothetical protein
MCGSRRFEDPLYTSAIRNIIVCVWPGSDASLADVAQRVGYSSASPSAVPLNDPTGLLHPNFAGSKATNVGTVTKDEWHSIKAPAGTA